MNLEVEKIQQKFFKVPVSAYDGKKLNNPEAKWLESFEKIMRSDIYVENNDY